jgi:TPR repeat protein
MTALRRYSLRLLAAQLVLAIVSPEFLGQQRKEVSMRTVKIGLAALVLAAFASVSAVAQTPSSEPVPERLSRRVEALSKKALAGDTAAQLRLGIAFEFGQGVDKNLDEAIHWYRIAADRGDPVAQTNLAYLFETGGNGSANPPEAAKWYLRAAVSGFARAEFNLGILYLLGTGVERSDEEAARWIREAADAGCPKAEATLGYLYANGKGVPRDAHKALELTEKAAKKNDPNLCLRLSHDPYDAATSERRSRSWGWNTYGNLR